MKAIRAAAFAALCLCILFLSVYGAGVYSWTLLLVTAVLLAAAAMNAAVLPRDTSVRLTIPGLLAVLFVTGLVLTSVPLPGHFGILGGPTRYAQNREVRLAVDSAIEYGVCDDVSRSFSVTRNRAGTLRIILLSLLAIASAWIAGSLTSRQRTWYLVFVLFLLSIVSVAGFLHQWIIPAKKTLWWIWTVKRGQPVGTFVNRTHHAGYVALGAPIALALLAGCIEQRKYFRCILAGLAFLAISFGVGMSLSRGAVLALASGSLLTLCMVAFRPPTRRTALAAIATILVVAGAVYAIINMPNVSISKAVRERMQTLEEPTETASAKTRFAAWNASVEIWKDYAIAGVGANGFRMLYPQYRTTSEREFMSHTENEFVAVFVEGGLIGVGLALAFLCVVVWTCIRNVRSSLVLPHTGMAVLGAVAVAAAHNLVDFPMHAPLYAMVVASLVGLCLIAPDGAQARGVRNVARFGKRWAVLAFAVPTAVVAISVLIWGVRPLVLDGYTFKSARSTADLAEILVRSPTWGEAWYRFGVSVRREGRPETIMLANECADMAVAMDPNNARLWRRVGVLRDESGFPMLADEAYDRMQELRPWMNRPVRKKVMY